MPVLAHLRVQVAADALLVPARNLAFKLLPSLALPDVVVQSGLLLCRAVLAVADGDGGPFSVPRVRSCLLLRVLRLRVRSLQPVAIVLAAIGDLERLTLQLLRRAADELRAAGGLLHVLLAADTLVLFPRAEALDARLCRIRLRPRPIVLLEIGAGGDLADD